MKKLIKNSLLLSILLAITSFHFWPTFVKSEPFFHDNLMKWAHKGCGDYNNYDPENFIIAQELGYVGIEIDLYQINKSILLQHDEDKASTPLLLKDITSQLKAMDLYYWFDLKGGFLTNEEINNLVQIFNENEPLKARSIVETDKISVLRRLKKNHIKSAFRTRLVKGNVFNRTLSYFKNNLVISIFAPIALAIPESQLKRLPSKHIKNQNILTWQDRNSSKDYSVFQNKSGYNIKVVLEACNTHNDTSNRSNGQ